MVRGRLLLAAAQILLGVAGIALTIALFIVPHTPGGWLGLSISFLAVIGGFLGALRWDLDRAGRKSRADKELERRSAVKSQGPSQSASNPLLLKMRRRKPPLRFPDDYEDAINVYKSWDWDNGRYWISARVLTKNGWSKVRFDFDSHMAMTVDGKTIDESHVGLKILDMKILDINGKAVNKPARFPFCGADVQ